MAQNGKILSLHAPPNGQSSHPSTTSMTGPHMAHQTLMSMIGRQTFSPSYRRWQIHRPKPMDLITGCTKWAILTTKSEDGTALNHSVAHRMPSSIGASIIFASITLLNILSILPNMIWKCKFSHTTSTNEDNNAKMQVEQSQSSSSLTLMTKIIHSLIGRRTQQQVVTFISTLAQLSRRPPPQQETFTATPVLTRCLAAVQSAGMH